MSRRKINRLRESSIEGIEEESPPEKTASGRIQENVLTGILCLLGGAGIGWLASEYMQARRVPAALKDNKELEQSFTGWVKENHPEYASKLGKAWEKVSTGWFLSILPSEDRPEILTQKSKKP